MRKPNIIYVYADDMGLGMLSCYGQKWFKTPNIDRLANEGMRFINSIRLFQLFYLSDDKQEENNLADTHPEKLHELATKMLKACDGNFYHWCWDNHKAVRLDEYLSGKAADDAFPVVKRWTPA